MDVVIYHIPNVKVGCTNNFIGRSNDNRKKYGSDIIIEVLENFSGSLGECADRECYWSQVNGFGLIRPDQRYDSEAQQYMLGMKGVKHNHTKIHGHTDESKAKMSISQKGKTHTTEAKAKISKTLTGLMVGEKNGMYGKTGSEKQKSAVGGIWKGKQLSEDHKKKMSESHQRIKVVMCPHCLKEGKPAPMKRWHFDNCKEINE